MQTRITVPHLPEKASGDHLLHSNFSLHSNLGSPQLFGALPESPSFKQHYSKFKYLKSYLPLRLQFFKYGTLKA